MKSNTLIYVAFIFTLFVAGFGPGHGITGKWKGTMQGPQGDIQLVFNFKVQGDSLSGTVQSQMGGAVPITNGKVNGSNFSFDVNFNNNTIHHDCSIAGDTVTMKIEGFPGNAMTLKLARVNGDQ